MNVRVHVCTRLPAIYIDDVNTYNINELRLGQDAGSRCPLQPPTLSSSIMVPSSVTMSSSVNVQRCPTPQSWCLELSHGVFCHGVLGHGVLSHSVLQVLLHGVLSCLHAPRRRRRPVAVAPGHCHLGQRSGHSDTTRRGHHDAGAPCHREISGPAAGASGLSLSSVSESSPAQPPRPPPHGCPPAHRPAAPPPPRPPPRGLSGRPGPSRRGPCRRRRRRRRRRRHRRRFPPLARRRGRAVGRRPRVAMPLAARVEREERGQRDADFKKTRLQKWFTTAGHRSESRGYDSVKAGRRAAAPALYPT
jgi:hypothetical protein